MTNFVDVGGPQFNPNPSGNQQGTLFSNRRLNAANKTGNEVGHKGYSENRLNEVRGEALNIWPDTFSPRVEKTFDAMNAAHVRRALPKAESMAKEEVHGAIAQTTVPHEDLRKFNRIVVDREPGGRYDPGSATIHVGAEWPGAPEGKQFLAHEIGHAVDDVAQKRAVEAGGVGGWSAREPGVASGIRLSQRDRRFTATEMATAEGFADAYKDRHAGESTSPYESLNDRSWFHYTQDYSSENAMEDERASGHPIESHSPAENYRQSRKEHGGKTIPSRLGPQFHQMSFGEVPMPEGSGPVNSWARYRTD